MPKFTDEEVAALKAAGIDLDSGAKRGPAKGSVKADTAQRHIKLDELSGITLNDEGAYVFDSLAKGFKVTVGDLGMTHDWTNLYGCVKSWAKSRGLVLVGCPTGEVRKVRSGVDEHGNATFTRYNVSLGVVVRQPSEQ